MSTLVDTNLLTRAAQAGHPMHQAAVDAVDILRQQGEELYLVPQNLYEFWVVCTRPIAQNGLGMTVAETHAEVTRLKQLFSLRNESAKILPEWEQLVTQFQIVGKNAHDARLVAAMRVHGINRILTFNSQDFQRYPGISVLSPSDLFQGPSPRLPTSQGQNP